MSRSLKRVPEDFHTIAVRNGQEGPVTCEACGCRLDDQFDGTWRHFGALDGRDARGHRRPCVEMAHDSHGRVAIPA